MRYSTPKRKTSLRMKMVAFPQKETHSQKAQLFSNIQNFLFGGADNVDADSSACVLDLWKSCLLILCCLHALALRCSYVVFRVSHGCRCLGRHHHFCPKIQSTQRPLAGVCVLVCVHYMQMFPLPRHVCVPSVGINILPFKFCVSSQHRIAGPRQRARTHQPATPYRFSTHTLNHEVDANIYG